MRGWECENVMGAIVERGEREILGEDESVKQRLICMCCQISRIFALSENIYSICALTVFILR
jgi:hypothetical protein